MIRYKYEMHAHTSEVSRCGSVSASELVQYYKSLGYDGICITDHFFNGNTMVPHDLAWKEKTDLFALGYQNAFKEGEKIGIKVFFG